MRKNKQKETALFLGGTRKYKNDTKNPYYITNRKKATVKTGLFVKIVKTITKNETFSEKPLTYTKELVTIRLHFPKKQFLYS